METIKHSRYLLLVIGLSLLPLVSVFSTTQLNHTHDGFVHLARIGAFYKALGDGQFPVRFAGDLNFGYGMPLFIFIYQVPYFIASFFVFLGLGLVWSFKITLALSFVLSGLFFFIFAKTLFKDERKALLTTLLYQFMPFHLVEIMVRGSFGEVYTYAFLPLVLYGLLKIFEKKQYIYLVLTSIATALLILSHNALSLVFFGVSILFIVFFGKNKGHVLGFMALLFGLLLSCFYWAPALLEHKYTYGDLLMKDLFKSHFAPFYYFLFPNIFNSESLQVGGINISVGLFQVIGLALSVYIYFKIKKDQFIKRIFLFSWVLFLGALFFMQPVSLFLWEHLSFLRQFQFPWRFLGLVGFAASLTGVSYLYFQFFRKKIVYFILCGGIFISTIVFWKPPLGYDSIDENYYWNFPLNTTYFGETDVIWSEGPAKSYPKSRVEFIAGYGRIENFQKKSNLQTFTVYSSGSANLISHTQYFPGWRVTVDGKAVPIEFQDINHRGEITFPIEKGTHDIQLFFGESKLRFLADIVSIVGVFGLVVFGLIYKKVYEQV